MAGAGDPACIACPAGTFQAGTGTVPQTSPPPFPCFTTSTHVRASPAVTWIKLDVHSLLRVLIALKTALTLACAACFSPRVRSRSTQVAGAQENLGRITPQQSEQIGQLVLFQQVSCRMPNSFLCTSNLTYCSTVLLRSRFHAPYRCYLVHTLSFWDFSQRRFSKFFETPQLVHPYRTHLEHPIRSQWCKEPSQKQLLRISVSVAVSHHDMIRCRACPTRCLSPNSPRIDLMTTVGQCRLGVICPGKQCDHSACGRCPSRHGLQTDVAPSLTTLIALPSRVGPLHRHRHCSTGQQRQPRPWPGTRTWPWPSGGRGPGLRLLDQVRRRQGGYCLRGRGKPVRGAGRRIPGRGKPVRGRGKPVRGAGRRIPGRGKPVRGRGKPVRGAGRRIPGLDRPQGGSEPAPIRPRPPAHTTPPPPTHPPSTLQHTLSPAPSDDAAAGRRQPRKDLLLQQGNLGRSRQGLP